MQAKAHLRSSPLALTLHQRCSHLLRAGAQGVQLSDALCPPPSCHPYSLCERITNTSPWHLEEPGLMHLDETASDLVPSLLALLCYLANHTIYFLLLSNGSIKHFKNTLNLWNNVVFIIVSVFVDALQTEPDRCLLSAPMVYSTESWFLPGRSSIFLCVTIQCAVPQCCLDCPGAVDQEIILAQECQVETLPPICQKHTLRVWPLVFSSLGTGVSAVFRVGLMFPHRTGWWWLVNPPEKILLNSKLHLCC